MASNRTKDSGTDNIESIRQTMLNAAREASRLITDASALQIKAIADAASQARTVVASQASEAVKVLNVKNADGGSDHDLLIRLDEKLTGLGIQIKDLSAGTTTRIFALEHDKLNSADAYPILYKSGVEGELKDHEDRIRTIDDKVRKAIIWGSVGVLAISVAETLLNIFHK